jgi:hypothetical protein
VNALREAVGRLRWLHGGQFKAACRGRWWWPRAASKNYPEWGLVSRSLSKRQAIKAARSAG